MNSISLKGPANNMDFVHAIISGDFFAKGETLTNFLDTTFSYRPCAVDVLSAGAFTTVQDTGRPKKGHGIPKSGPMDTISARISNLLVDNPVDMELLEITLNGPELLFASAAVFAVCGANVPVTVDGKEVKMWTRAVVGAGQKLKIGDIKGPGIRAYLAIKGGFPNIPLIFESKATTPSLKYGGTQGRQVRQGDYLELSKESPKWAEEAKPYTLPSESIPNTDVKEVYVMQGPHDSEDIMTAGDLEMMYTTDWKVGHNSNRTGIKLIGPAPKWARKDGGEAGSHPSNIQDFGYPSPGGLNWGGDSSLILSQDSPNFGGLVCSTTVVNAELWKLGQLRPDDRVKLTPISMESALKQRHAVAEYLKTMETLVASGGNNNAPKLELERPRDEPNGRNAILKEVESDGPLRPKVVYRQVCPLFELLSISC